MLLRYLKNNLLVAYFLQMPSWRVDNVHIYMCICFCFVDGEGRLLRDKNWKKDYHYWWWWCWSRSGRCRIVTCGLAKTSPESAASNRLYTRQLPAPIFLSDLDNRTRSSHSGFIWSWKTWKSHGILKQQFSGLESFGKNKWTQNVLEK